MKTERQRDRERQTNKRRQRESDRERERERERENNILPYTTSAPGRTQSARTSRASRIEGAGHNMSRA
eukprot:3174346-Rhodomonas_salina.2